MVNRAKRWVFTLNNYTTGEVDLLIQLAESEHVHYCIFGKEIGENGTPHLQGYIVFEQEKRLNQLKRLVGSRYHFEISRGTPTEASEYCKKDGDYIEIGTLPKNTNEGGKKGKWDQLVEYITTINAEEGERPTETDLYARFPGLMGPQRRGVIALVDSLYRPPSREIGQLNDGWQRDLFDQLSEQPDDRRIVFVIDPVGNSGKSWFCRYMQKLKPDATQYLRIGKRDDLAHALDPRRTIFLFDVPRRGMEYFQYVIVESLKDGQVFSPKYNSCTKDFQPCHCVVFCNEDPDMGALTTDRYKIIRISERAFNP